MENYKAKQNKRPGPPSTQDVDTPTYILLSNESRSAGSSDYHHETRWSISDSDVTLQHFWRAGSDCFFKLLKITAVTREQKWNKNKYHYQVIMNTKINKEYEESFHFMSFMIEGVYKKQQFLSGHCFQEINWDKKMCLNYPIKKTFLKLNEINNK